MTKDQDNDPIAAMAGAMPQVAGTVSAVNPVNTTGKVSQVKSEATPPLKQGGLARCPFCGGE